VCISACGKRSLLKSSNILLEDAPFHRVEFVGISPLAERTTISLKVTSEYRSFSSSIILNWTPDSVILSPTRPPILASLSLLPSWVRNHVLLMLYNVLWRYWVPSLIIWTHFSVSLSYTYVHMYLSVPVSISIRTQALTQKQVQTQVQTHTHTRTRAHMHTHSSTGKRCAS